MTWHLDSETVARYRDNTLSDAHAASVEAHVVRCADCQTRFRDPADSARHADNWAAITDRIDAPHRSIAERLLVRLGVREHTARLLTLTPTLNAAWVGALVVVSALAVAAGNERTPAGGDRGLFLFLVLAPLLPVLGVAAAFGARTDPAHELTVASPVSAMELLLVRAVAVLATSTPISAVAALVLPGDTWRAAAWLLPALGMTTATLALARWVRLHFAAAALGALWLTAAAVATRGSSATTLVRTYAPFRPAGQVLFLAMFVIAAASISATRQSFDLRRAT